MKIWHNCYDKQLKGFLTPASFVHPAKISLALCERIIDYALEQGYLKPGDVVADCFNGVGTVGLVAAYRGLRYCGVELEPRFVDLTRANFAFHRHKLYSLFRPQPTVIQGDSRHFHKLIGEAQAIVSSPPYADANGHPSLGHFHDESGGDVLGRTTTGAKRGDEEYGSTVGQIGGLRGGDVSAVISSPPYATISAGAGGLNTKPAKHPGQQSWRKTSDNQDTDQRYGQTDGQIARLKEGTVNAVVSSPPWEQNSEGSRKASKFKSPEAILACSRGNGASDAAVLDQAERDSQKVYGDSEGQIGKLKGGDIDGIVTSPPYAANSKSDRQMSDDGKTRRRDTKRDFKQGHGCFRGSETYGITEGQIGNEKPESYWQAMAAVYNSCLIAIKPGGYIILIVKDYVKNKKRVPLCDDTCRLLEHVGFVMVERIHAMLVSETRESDMFIGESVKTKSRKSFFRRLTEKKGSPEINFEEVLVFQKPL